MRIGCSDSAIVNTVNVIFYVCLKCLKNTNKFLEW